ncbi:MAG TPA: hypothetical protein VLH75_07405, partial [Longimicrobiales bacterium]|nr:hypothetical protein [Longimicrobiales bacterium]
MRGRSSRPLRCLLLGAALALALAPAVPRSVRAQQPDSPPVVGPARGSLVVVGGAMQSPEIYRRFIELAGGPDAPLIMIPTAGGGAEYDAFYDGLTA